MSSELWEKALTVFASALSTDSWQNFITGFGTARDKTEGGTFGAEPVIPDAQLAALYHHDDIAGRICDCVPLQALRQGIVLEGATPETIDRLMVRMSKLRAIPALREAWTWGRVFGGGLMFIGADDGLDASAPLDVSRVRRVVFFQVYDKRMVQIERWHEDTEHPRFGEPRIYRLTNHRTGRSSAVHESRVLKFGGAKTSDQERYQNSGWDYSVLQKPYRAMRQFAAIHKAAELLMTDASQGVFRMRGLLSAIAAGRTQDLLTRAIFMDQSRSIARSIMLDAEGGESFEKVQTAFSGIGDMLSHAALRLSAATEIPVTVLMGQSPAGLNATGASDIQLWYDKLKQEQEVATPNIEKLVGLIAVSLGVDPEPLTVRFPSLWQETPKEKADREKVEADTAAVWIGNEILTPEEVALARFSGDEPQPYRIDPKTRTGP